METEKSVAQSEAEKKVIDSDLIGVDLSGHSEKQIDINLNKAVSDSHTQQKPIAGIFSIFQSKKEKEKVLLDTKAE